MSLYLMLNQVSRNKIRLNNDKYVKNLELRIYSSASVESFIALFFIDLALLIFSASFSIFLVVFIKNRKKVQQYRRVTQSNEI